MFVRYTVRSVSMYASIILLTKQAGPYLDRLLPTLFSQVVPEPYEVLAVDSGSTDGTLEQLGRWPVRVRRIKPAEFGFGRTKNLAAAEARGRALVFLSQDALPLGPRWLANLVGNLDAPRVAGSYGRQLPWPTTRPPMVYFLDHTYPARRIVRRGAAAGADGVAFSNANAAVRREVWEQHPFDEQLLMSEDQEWARRVCGAGYEIVYDPSAAVYHAHGYTLPGIFKRSFDSGATLKRILEDSAGPVTSRGAAYLLGEVGYLIRRGEGHWIPYSLAFELSRLAGYLAGTQEQRIPLPLKRRLSWHGQLW
jgi:rhamnosyltransferase